MSKTNESLMQRRRPAGRQPAPPDFRQPAFDATVTDVEGREFIDFAGSIAVLNTDHLHPKVVEAVQEQLTRCFQSLAYEPYVKRCEKI